MEQSGRANFRARDAAKVVRVLRVIQVSPHFLITSSPGSKFPPSTESAYPNALIMISTLLVAALMGSLPFVTYSWTHFANETTLHPNDTASNEDSWLGWVSNLPRLSFLSHHFESQGISGKLRVHPQACRLSEACTIDFMTRLERTSLTAKSAIGC